MRLDRNAHHSPSATFDRRRKKSTNSLIASAWLSSIYSVVPILAPLGTECSCSDTTPTFAPPLHDSPSTRVAVPVQQSAKGAVRNCVFRQGFSR
mmetsp:Transcript_9643/g.20768  ORF Transcript_9643/g.20768 Transcript_9643/m.20768 type:complete len:94 (-) Transcript_9643:281-562(-)